jgi:hypothetical protein
MPLYGPAGNGRPGQPAAWKHSAPELTSGGNGDAQDGGRSRDGERTTTLVAASTDAATRPRKHKRKRGATSYAAAPLVDVSTSVASFHSGSKSPVVEWRWSEGRYLRGGLYFRRQTGEPG